MENSPCHQMSLGTICSMYSTLNFGIYLPGSIDLIDTNYWGWATSLFRFARLSRSQWLSLLHRPQHLRYFHQTFFRLQGLSDLNGRTYCSHFQPVQRTVEPTKRRIIADNFFVAKNFFSFCGHILLNFWRQVKTLNEKTPNVEIPKFLRIWKGFKSWLHFPFSPT